VGLAKTEGPNKPYPCVRIVDTLVQNMIQVPLLGQLSEPAYCASGLLERGFQVCGDEIRGTAPCSVPDVC